MSDTLYAIDVYSLVFQVFHAIPPMTSPSGQPTNAVYGFTRDLMGLMKTKKPTYMVCAMDGMGPVLRDDIYEDYKANRDEMPDDLKPQIPMIVEVIESLGIPAIGAVGWEADDVLATLAARTEVDGIDCTIVTSDKDARQLISPTVRLFNVRKNTYMGAEGLKDDWGIRPDQVVDFQALVGDAVDNVPGVPLVGPKKACILLNDFGTLEEVLARADEAKGKKLQENLKTFADQARLSRQLVELNRELDFELDWESARVGQQMDVPALVQIFRECGFRRLIDQVRQLAPEDATPAQQIFADGEPVVEVIKTDTELDDFLAKIPQDGEISLRLETSGLEPFRSQVVAVTIGIDESNAGFASLSEIVSDSPISADVFWPKLKMTLNSKNVSITGNDLKSTLISLSNVGIDDVNLGLDTMVGSYLIEAGSRIHSLSSVVDGYYGTPLKRVSKTVLASDTEDGITTQVLADYSAEEACVSIRVAKKMDAELAEENLLTLYNDLERPLISVLAEMERTGIKVDSDELASQNEEITARIKGLVEEIHDEAGEEFNVDSPKQLQAILFDKLELPVIKKTKTGASTDQDVLEQLAQLHPLPAKVIDHRHLVKLKGTYLDALPLMINANTGRIHASFNQVVAATGRLSSSNPNLQNIPIRTSEGERIRRAFIPGEPGWKMICADYSQIELRMLAHFSQDAALLQAFADGVDVHSAVASQIFGVTTNGVDSNMRRIAKAVNFGVIYGQTPWGLSAALSISKEEAGTFINDYFERYQGVADFIDSTLRDCSVDGYATTILDRRRKIAGVRSSRSGGLNMPERTAVNTVIQGSAADLIKLAMINIARRLSEDASGTKMLMQIHDELVFEAPESDLDRMRDLVQEEMENAMQLSVPITVDIATGDNWLDSKS
jgi:DNA polymerase I